jgi:hypothetical protein
MPDSYKPTLGDKLPLDLHGLSTLKVIRQSKICFKNISFDGNCYSGTSNKRMGLIF